MKTTEKDEPIMMEDELFEYLVKKVYFDSNELKSDSVGTVGMNRLPYFVYINFFLIVSILWVFLVSLKKKTNKKHKKTKQVLKWLV